MVETKLSARAERVEGLLALYPDIAPADTEEIVRFLKTGPHLEIGLLTARDGIGSRLQAFRRDHHRRFRLGARDLLVFLLVTAVPLAAFCWYVWSKVNGG